MESTENEIIQLEEKLRKAQIESNTNVLDELISDDLVCTFIDGLLYTKQQDLDMHKSGTFKISEMVPSERIIKVIGDTAIVNVLMEIKGKAGEQVIDDKCRYTRVWAKENGNWKIVVAHIGSVKL